MIWMIKYVQYLIITCIIALHLENFCRHNELFATHDQVDEPHGNWRIIVIQSDCKTEFTYYVCSRLTFTLPEKTINIYAK